MNKVSGFSMDTFYICAQDWKTNWTCEQIAYEDMGIRQDPITRIMIVPHTVPQFLHPLYLTMKLTPRVQVHSTSQETSQPVRQTPTEQRPGSPSVRQVPTVAYTGVHMPPKTPFQ